MSAFPVAAAVNLLVAAVMAMSAVNVVREDAATLALLQRVGARRVTPIIAAAGAAGAGGLVLGLFVAPIGVLAGIGVVAFMCAALVAHIRAGDPNVAPPLVIGTLAALATLLRVLTA